MSGLYNILFNVNPLAGSLLALLKIKPGDVPRLRDCFLNPDGTEIIVYTRAGGGNRHDYAEQIETMRRFPGYKGDYDEPVDQTYALFRYEVPEQYREVAKRLAEEGYGVDPSKRWRETLDEIRRESKQ